MPTSRCPDWWRSSSSVEIFDAIVSPLRADPEDASGVTPSRHDGLLERSFASRSQSGTDFMSPKSEASGGRRSEGNVSPMVYPAAAGFMCLGRIERAGSLSFCSGIPGVFFAYAEGGLVRCLVVSGGERLAARG